MQRLLGIGIGLVIFGSSLGVQDASQDAPPAKKKRPTTTTTSAPASQPAQKVAISEITRDMIGLMVRTRGTVESIVQKPSRRRERIHIVTLKDGDATIEMIYWEDIAKQLGDAVPKEGETLRVTGRVSDYRGKLQLALEDPADLKRPKKKDAGAEGAKPDEKHP